VGEIHGQVLGLGELASRMLCVWHPHIACATFSIAKSRDASNTRSTGDSALWQKLCRRTEPPAHRPQRLHEVMVGKACSGRLQKEYKALIKEPRPNIEAHPLPTNVLEW